MIQEVDLKLGQWYWFISSGGKVKRDRWGSGLHCLYRYLTHNVFLSPEDAEAYKKEVLKKVI